MDREIKQGRWKRSASFWMGATCTAAFYAMVSLPQFRGGSLERYTAHHATEFVTVALFFWAMADLLVKYWRLKPDWRSVERVRLVETDGQIAPAKSAEVAAKLHSTAGSFANTWFYKRLHNGLGYVRDKGSAEGLDDHLKYLAEVDAERSHAGYSLVRFIAWVTPILGFLGTVVHFTMAIAQVTPEQLEHSLGAVTTALGVAFDTTALALSLSIVVMFFIYLVEQGEKNLLHEVELRTYRELGHRFKTLDASTAPFVAALKAGGETTLANIQTLVERQAQIWAQTFAESRRQAEESTNRLLEYVSQSMRALNEQSIGRQAEAENRFVNLLQTMQAERTWMNAERLEQCNSMTIAAQQIASVQQEMLRLGQQLTAVIAGEKNIVGLQELLVENLGVLQQTQRFDEAVNSLTAAIHLMTVRKLPGNLELRQAA